jgi:hypothetical protein
MCLPSRGHGGSDAKPPRDLLPFVGEEVNRSEVEAPFGSPSDPNNLDSDSDGLAYEVVGGGGASPSASSASLSQAPKSYRIATIIPRPQPECASEGGGGNSFTGGGGASKGRLFGLLW